MISRGSTRKWEISGKDQLHSSDSTWAAKSLISSKTLLKMDFSPVQFSPGKLQKTHFLVIYSSSQDSFSTGNTCLCVFTVGLFFFFSLFCYFWFCCFFLLSFSYWCGGGAQAVNNFTCCFVGVFLWLSFFLCPFYSACLTSSSLTLFLQEISIGLRLVVVNRTCRKKLSIWNSLPILCIYILPRDSDN